MKGPLVSVIVATYRRDVSLKNALESIAAQTYQTVEIVLVDDNANEQWNQKVSEIVRALKNKYPLLLLNHVLNESNRGSAKARNIGIYSSRGEYITFLDDDDIYLPDKIKMQLEHMIDKNSDYSITDIYLYSEKNTLIDLRIRGDIENMNKEELIKYHLMYHITGTDAMMYKKSYLEKIGCFPLVDVGDEFYLMLQAIIGGGKLSYLNACGIKAYVHTGEGGLSSGEKKIKGENDLYRYKQQYFKDVSRKCRRYIRMRHYAVLAFAEIRRKRHIAFLINGFKSFISAPVACLRLLLLQGGKESS